MSMWDGYSWWTGRMMEGAVSPPGAKGAGARLGEVEQGQSRGSPYSTHHPHAHHAACHHQLQRLQLCSATI